MPDNSVCEKGSLLQQKKASFRSKDRYSSLASLESLESRRTLLALPKFWRSLNSPESLRNHEHAPS